jgi:tetratricopeptide (TPR) repeat protein
MTATQIPNWEHAYSRFQCATKGLIHQLQKDFFDGRSPGKTVPGIDSDMAAVMVAETLEADIVWNHPDAILEGIIKKRRMSDFLRAVIAEICFGVAKVARENKDEQSVQKWQGIAMASLLEISATPTASPLLDYADIYFELSQEARDPSKQEALDWLQRALAHNLQYTEGSNAMNTLRDIAEWHLRAGEFDRGLSMLAALLRHAPADIWTYNVMAITFDQFGLADLGTQATLRGLQLLDVQKDEEKLLGQLMNCLTDMQNSKIKGNETKVAPAILDEFQRALNLGFDAGQPVPIPQLCRELVPDLDQTPVKRPLTSRDFPLPNPEQILAEIQGSANVIRTGKSRRRKRKHG